MNRDSLGWQFVRSLVHLPVAAAVFAVFGCDMRGDSGDAEAPSADDHWRIVQAYIDTDTAWHAKTDEIFRADDSEEERDRRLKEERGEHPDIMLAVTAARAIVDAGGERVLEAAEFLAEHPRGLSTTEAEDIEFGMAALKSLVGPDWSRVETLKNDQDEWQQRYDEINDADIPDDEKRERRDELGDAPADTAAVAAALSIVELADQEHGREAAEFLIKPGVGPPAPEIALMAAKALLEHFPDYDDWPNVLSWLDGVRPWDRNGVVYDFIAEMAANASDPVDRATARYFAAAALMDGLGRGSTTPEERDDMRGRALEHAVGLSLGVEEEAFVRELTVDGESVTKTLAESEAMLVHGLRHATAGGTLADETGWRLDGSEEKLSAYAGKVVLLDFWATWCGPCIGALPELRELAASYPKDRFEILAISVDEEVEEVTEFMEEEPMPWAHWHIGAQSELGRSWQIRVFPTYMVVDADGTILSRGLTLEESKALIENALDDEPSASPAASEV